MTKCSPTSVLFVDLGNTEEVEEVSRHLNIIQEQFKHNSLVEVRSLPQGLDQLPGQAVLLDVVSGPTQDQLVKIRIEH